MKTILTALFLAGAACAWAQSDELYVSKNVFTPGTDTVDIQVTAPNFPNTVSLRIYNSVGELVRILEHIDTIGAFTQSYSWDGKNVNGDKVASGVYLILFKDNQSLHTARILAVQ
ncbi:MAG TPA: FlgD immunoglobulin-like domain containing protein [bacterium]|nr:FlgD immunoglobulin-like domain containing protein [bacterium]